VQECGRRREGHDVYLYFTITTTFRIGCKGRSAGKEASTLRPFSTPLLRCHGTSRLVATVLVTASRAAPAAPRCPVVLLPRSLRTYWRGAQGIVPILAPFRWAVPHDGLGARVYLLDACP